MLYERLSYCLLVGFIVRRVHEIEQVDTTLLDRPQRFEYYFSLFRIYTYWADFCNDRHILQHTEKEQRTTLRRLCLTAIETDKSYEYYCGEYAVLS